MANKALTLQITVDSLTRGKRVEANDVVELLAIEEQILARTFKAVLEAAAQFGGEEVVEV